MRAEAIPLDAVQLLFRQVEVIIALHADQLGIRLLRAARRTTHQGVSCVGEPDSGSIYIIPPFPRFGEE
jgi:hypothetical protein